MAQDKKADGSPILVLNLSQTYVEAIPERLRGVDRVISAGSIQYIAPDYKGEVVEIEPGKPWNRHRLTKDEIMKLKICFNRRNCMARGIFEQSYLESERCAGYPDEEKHLPAGLRFTWNPKTGKGKLDAQKTLIEHAAPIANIEEVKLAQPQVILDRLARQQKFAKQCAGKNARRDFNQIAIATRNSVVHF